MATTKSAPANRAPAKKSAAKKPAAKKAAAPARPASAKPSSNGNGRPKRKQPEALRLRAASPSLTVNDIERSLRYYTHVLGFTVKDRWELDGTLMGAELQAGTVMFMIGQDDWQRGRDRPKGIGFRIHCTTAQDVDVVAAEIKQRGGALDYEPRDDPWGGRSFAVTDPDGFKVTISRS